MRPVRVTLPGGIIRDHSTDSRSSAARSKSPRLYRQIFLATGLGLAGTLEEDMSKCKPRWSALAKDGIVLHCLPKTEDETKIRSIRVEHKLDMRVGSETI